MPNYTFTVASSYALSTHEVSFSATTITIKLTSTGQTVYTKTYGLGVAFMCQSNDFCIGTLTDNGVFTKTIDMGLKAAEMKLVEASGQNKFIGTNDHDDPSVTHKYNLNQCPVRLVKGTKNDVEVECPCQSSSGPCGNDCYSIG